MDHNITRRQFMKTTAIGAAAAYFAPDVIFGVGDVFAAENKSRVAMASHSQIVDASEHINSKIVGTVVNEEDTGSL